MQALVQLMASCNKRTEGCLTTSKVARQLMLYRCCIYYSREGVQKMKQYPVWTELGAEMIRQIAAEEDEE